MTSWRLYPLRGGPKGRKTHHSGIGFNMNKIKKLKDTDSFLCYRTVKTIIHNMTKLKGNDILHHLQDIPPQSELYTYLVRVLKVAYLQ